VKVDVEAFISTTLRAGVTISVIVMFSGILFTFIHHPAYFSSRPALGELTSGGGDYPHSVREVLHGIAAHHGQAIAMLGVLLLIATPVMRVAISVLLFAAEKDFRYVLITAVVLAILLTSMLSGLAVG
jgi:uncharacterized membrane protein